MWTVLLLVRLLYLDAMADYLEILVFVISILQVIGGLISTRAYKDVLLKVLDTLQTKFWFNDLIIQNKILENHTLYYKILSKISIIYQTVTIITLTVVYLNPYTYLERKLPMEIYFSHNNFIKEWPYYQIIYILQTISACFSGFYAVVIPDIIYIQVIGFTLIQIDLIKHSLRVLTSEEVEEIDLYKKLKKCIEHHNVVLDVLADMELMYKYIMLTKAFCGTVILCCTGYTLTIDFTGNLKWITVFCFITSQIFLYNFCGDLVTNECASIGEEAYNVNWEHFGYKSVTFGLSMMIMRAQSPVLMTAGGMFVLSLPNFLAFMKMAYSFYILLNK